MRLPAGSLREFGGGDAAGPLQQIKDLGSLTAVAGITGLLPRPWARSSPRRGFFPDLVFAGATLRAPSSYSGLLVGLRAAVLGSFLFFRDRCVHVRSFAVIATVTTWITPT